MQVYLNGKFVPDDEACISVHDRGFLYGDGLFETIRVYDGEPFLWSDHMHRLAHGCEVIRIHLPLTPSEMLCVVAEQLRRNGLRDALIRITISRGAGLRGYSPTGADHPTFCILAFPPPQPLPTSWKLISSSLRLQNEDPLAVFKHANKLRQIIARAEADDRGADEALLLNDRGEVVEGTTTNVFWVEKGAVCTPRLSGILSGVTRNYILRLCAFLGIDTHEKNIPLKTLLKAEGILVTASGIEVMAVSEIDGHSIKTSALVKRLKQEYRKADLR
jgi:branched-chain amino acid aminotransferase